MNRIQELFSRKKKNILSVFYTAGFPALTDTIPIAIELQKAGVDSIEIGIPFSDPVADGPVIQESNTIALANGMKLEILLEQVREMRQSVTLPIVLMGYLNPIMQYGVERFCEKASAYGVDGVILPDMPMIEFEKTYEPMFLKHHLLNTFLISPTTSDERIRKIDRATNGFIYAVSSSSTTGAKNVFAKEQEEYFQKLEHMNLNNPYLIGFGISNHKTFSTACRFANGAIVGSAFISHLQKQSLKNITSFIESIIAP
ncbi:MAG: tryptophan synthase subunit alpha [Flammeovirgaceae bacterium]